MSAPRELYWNQKEKEDAMKPNPEQDADRDAFEKLWADTYPNDVAYFAQYNDQGLMRDMCRLTSFQIFQAAKADSRAMQDAFEQVCVEAEKVQQWQSDDGIAPYYDLAKALSLAAQFRKTGV